MFVLIFSIAIETFAIHLLLLKWSETAAWILTGISIYTAIQVFGLAKSITQRPIVIKYLALDRSLMYPLTNLPIPYTTEANVSIQPSWVLVYPYSSIKAGIIIEKFCLQR